MKMKSLVPTFALAISMCSSAKAQVAHVPSVGNVWATSTDGDAGAAKALHDRRQKGVPKIGQDGAIINVLAFSGPQKAEDEYIAAANELFQQWINSGVITNSTMLRGFKHIGPGLGWTNVVYSENTPMYNGVLNPDPPHQLARGDILWYLIEAQSKNGDDLALNEVEATIRSTGGAHDTVITFDGLRHTPRAPLVMANGTVIDNGDTSQLGHRTAALISPPQFNGGGTQVGLNAAKEYFREFNPYAITNMARIKGHDETTLTLILSSGTPTPTNAPVAPMLRITRNPTNAASATLSVANAETNRTYRLISRPTADTGMWELTGSIVGTASVVIPLADQSRFFIAATQ